MVTEIYDENEYLDNVNCSKALKKALKELDMNTETNISMSTYHDEYIKIKEDIRTLIEKFDQLQYIE